MNAIASIPTDTLPVLIDRATRALESARNSAEVLEARDMARVAYDAAKSASRILKAKQAHDSLVVEVRVSQAAAISIHARAQIRLAEEYDAAQEKGEAATSGQPEKPKESAPEGANTPPTQKATAEDVGGKKALENARVLEKAERLIPGIVDRITTELIQQDIEPTMAAVLRGVKEAVAELSAKPKPKVMDPRALWVWGRLKDFERNNVLEASAEFLLSEMTEPMREDVLRLAPLVREFIEDLEVSNV